MGANVPSSIMICIYQILFLGFIWQGLATAQTTESPLPPTVPQPCPSGCHCDFQTRVVNCQQGSFTSVPTNFPSYTTTLILRGNIFQTLLEDSFVGLPNLASLDLTTCEIATISPRAFNGLHNLRILNLQLNHLSTLPPGTFEGLTNLRELNLQRNRLERIPSGMFNDILLLKVLDINDNRISQIDDDAFSGLSLLSSLRLTYNQLSSIPEMPLKNLTNLQILALSGNPITTLPSRAFISLTLVDLLYLDNMQLESLEDDSFAGLQSVTTLDLSYNQFRILDPIAFQSLSSLNTLLLSGNLWDCECPLFPFVQWLIQSSIIYYSTSWFCTTPSDLNGNVVYALQSRDFACEPVITNAPLNTVVRYNERVHFECAAKGDPTPTIQWYGPDGTRISATSNDENVYTALNGIVLVIQSATEENSGIYNCTASNVRGSDSVRFQVVVDGAPEGSTIGVATVSDKISTAMPEPTRRTCTSFPLELMLEDISESSITVTWTPYTGNEELTGYIVQSHMFGDQSETSNFVNWTSVSYGLTNLFSNTGYTVCAAFLLENCPLVVPREQCMELTTLGEDPVIATIQAKHRNEIIGTALAGILGTLFLMASVFLILWRYRKPKKYNHYDFKGNKDTAAFAGIPEDIDREGFIVSEGMASGSTPPEKYQPPNGDYINHGLDMSPDNTNDYVNGPVAANMTNDNDEIQYSADVHSDIEPPVGYTSAAASNEDVTDTTASMKSASSVVTDDGLKEVREPKDKASKVKKSRPSLSSHESLDSDGVIEMTNLGTTPHSNGNVNIANEIAV